MKKIIYHLKKPYHFVKTGLIRGLRAQLKYRFPTRQLKIITITGTDGKTTSSTLTYHLLKSAGKKVGLISTVAAYIGEREIDTGLHVTAPGPEKIMGFARRMVDKGFEYLILEMTSHGAYQYRSWGIKPDIAGLTNITNEHLDYHITYELYLKAKALILKKAKTVILNQDDRSYPKIRNYLKLEQQQIRTYSSENELEPELKQAVEDRFSEDYNQMNARLAIKIAKELELETKQIAVGISSFPGVAGRMQQIKVGKPFEVVVDFAHTPNALKQALTALRARMDERPLKKQGRIIAIFGCAGLRDAHKRAAMGQIAVDLADLAVFTAEDPRTENIWSIIRQMKEQLTSGHDRVISIADRLKAIEFALSELAKPQDIIVILGKGPEKSMCLGQTEHPWSDEKIVKRILNKS